VDKSHLGGWTQTFGGKSEQENSRPVENAILPTSPAFGAPVGMIPSEFSKDLLRRKTRVSGLSCGVVFDSTTFTVLVAHRLVTDKRTDRLATTASIDPHEHSVARVKINPFEFLYGANLTLADYATVFTARLEHEEIFH